MSFTSIVMEKRDRVAKIVLNRPSALNAIDDVVLREIGEAVADLGKDEGVRAVIITGKGKAFSVGADLKLLKLFTDESMDVCLRKLDEFGILWHRVFKMIEDSPKPTIAAINGFAFAGGLELAEVCDLAICSEEAILGDQHANSGLVPGGGGTQRLPRLISRKKAMELLLTGDRLSPQEAERLGLVNKVVPANRLEEEAMALARKLADRSPVASRTIKMLVNRGLEMALPDALEFERRVALQHQTTEDMAEGVRAFIEKRKPEFPGR